MTQWPLDLAIEADQVKANFEGHALTAHSSSLSMDRDQVRLASDLVIAAESQPLSRASVDFGVGVGPDCMRLSGSLVATLVRPWQIEPDVLLQQLDQAQAEFDVCSNDLNSALQDPSLTIAVDGLAVVMDEAMGPIERFVIELKDGQGDISLGGMLDSQPLTAAIHLPSLPGAVEAGAVPFQLDVDYQQVASVLSGNLQWQGQAVSLQADLTATGRGDGQLKLAAGLQLDNEKLSIENWTVYMVGVDLGGRFEAQFSEPPRINVEVNAGLIDKQRLVHYLRRLDQELEEAEQQDDAFDWLGADLEFIDQLLAAPLIDFRVGIEEVAGLAVEVSNITAAGHLGAGRIDQAQVSAEFDNLDLTGQLDADFSGDHESVALLVDAENVDLDAVLRRLNIHVGTEIQAPSASLSVQSTGANLSSLLTHADLELSIPQTRFDMGGGDELWRTVAINHLVVGTGVGEPVRLTAEVDIDGAPMTAELLAPSIDDLLNKPDQPIAAQLTLGSEEDQLTAIGRVLRPVSDERFEATIELTGDRLDLLDGADDDLQPALGPYSIKAKVDMAPERIELELTEAIIGYSQLLGSVTVDQSQSRPSIQMRVDAERIRVEDLLDLEPSTDSSTDRDEPVSIAEQLDRFFNDYLPEIALESDLSLHLQADEIRANNQLLGSGVATAQLSDRQLTVSQLEIITPHGEITGTLDLADTESGAGIDLNLDINGLDMAVIAERAGHQSDGLGLLFMKADLHGEGENVDAMRRSLQGRLDLFFWPENLAAGAYDLWVSNLLLAILPVFGKGESNFNCAVARFAIEQGVMNAETLMVDTSKMVVHGRGQIDLADQTLLLGFVPQSKKAAFLSMETPVTIKGPIDDFGVSVGPLDMAFSAFRLYYNVLYVPYQWMRGRALPEDGMPICLREMQWEQPEARPAALQHFPVPFEDQKKPRRSR